MSDSDNIQNLANALKNSEELKQKNSEAETKLTETQRQIVGATNELSALRQNIDKETVVLAKIKEDHSESVKIHKGQIVDLGLQKQSEAQALQELKDSIEKEKLELVQSHAELDKKKEALEERIKTNTAVINDRKLFIEKAKTEEAALESKRVQVSADSDAMEKTNASIQNRDAELTQRASDVTQQSNDLATKASILTAREADLNRRDAQILVDEKRNKEEAEKNAVQRKDLEAKETIIYTLKSELETKGVDVEKFFPKTEEPFEDVQAISEQTPVESAPEELKEAVPQPVAGVKPKRKRTK